jgi:hypothetical protein
MKKTNKSRIYQIDLEKKTKKKGGVLEDCSLFFFNIHGALSQKFRI